MKENLLDTLCLSCMKDAGEKFEHCPFCGAPASIENQFHQLVPKSVLNGRFVVGKTLGQGGFGITYAGYDITTDTKVAIKEFYPDGGVARQKDLYTILPYSEKKTEELFADGKTKFLKEAQKLVQFANIEGIVQVKDYFEENGTAYIVMEYVEGPTLIQYLNKLGQPILPSDLYALLTPIFNALEQVHAQGILHRDISPDNIIVSPSVAKLLDFGAARDFSLLGEKSNTINIKAGYAPEEQYLTHGKQGPWTDVYALCATCYRAVTGKTPSSSIERLSGDNLVPPSTLSVNVTPAIEQVLLKGMAVRKENRYQSVKELRDAFNQAINDAPANLSPQMQPVYAAAQPQPGMQQSSTSQPQYNNPQQSYTPLPQYNNPRQSNSQQLNYSSSWEKNSYSGSLNNYNSPNGMTPQQSAYTPSNANQGKQSNVPLVLGILSLVLYVLLEFVSDIPFGYGSIVGMGLGIAAICVGNKAKKRSAGNGKIFAGIITGIVGLCISALWFIFLLIIS